MDASDLSPLGSGMFDVILEKFTLDAMLCEAKDDAEDPRGCAALREFHRVLSPCGVLLSIAWGEKRRAPLLRAGGLFDVESQRLAGEASQRPFIYVCKKRAAVATALTPLAA